MSPGMEMCINVHTDHAATTAGFGYQTDQVACDVYDSSFYVCVKPLTMLLNQDRAVRHKSYYSLQLGILTWKPSNRIKGYH